MLKKLQRKFVLTNMIFVGIVLSVAFSLFCVNTYVTGFQEIKSTLAKSIDAMQNNDSPPYQIQDDSFDNGSNNYNGTSGNKNYVTGKESDDEVSLKSRSFESGVVSLVVNSSGQVYRIEPTPNFMGEESLFSAVNIVLAKGSDSGEIPELNLYYFKVYTAEKETYIAFANLQDFHNQMRSTIFISILLGTGSMIIFFFISLLMSKIAINPVKKAWKQQRQFIADASHELKTPLTVILANNNILLSKKDDTIEQQKKWIENSQEEALHMKNLVNNLLFLAKSDAEGTVLKKEKISLSDLFIDNILQFEPIAFEKKIEIVYDIEPNGFIFGDQTQIKQLIQILLDNACKYANTNGMITCSLVKYKGTISISINNTGKHIPISYIPHIFERFYRLDQARTIQSGEGGYGLGLAIAKDIVTTHRGKISVTSDATRGTTFTVDFKI